MEQQQPQQPHAGGVAGPTGRRLHIAHRRSPSEMTPLVSIFAQNPGIEQIAIQQQLELLHQQQQQIQATQQHYANMGIPLAGGAFNPLQAPNLGMGPQSAFQFPNQLPQHTVAMGAPSQPMSHRRNQSAIPSMGMGPPPAPSSGASGSAFGGFENQPGGGHGRSENAPTRGGRGGGGAGGGGGHQRRHSLALADAKKAAEIAQQKRTTAGFQFPAPGATGSDKADEEAKTTPTQQQQPQTGGVGTGGGAAGGDSGQQQQQQQQQYGSQQHGSGMRGRGSGHGRSQSMAAGPNGRGGRGGGSTHYSNDSMRGGSMGHARTSSRNFEGNWRSQGPSQPQDQGANVPGQQQQQQQQQQQGFQPGHRARASMNQSINSIGSFQYQGQPQLLQIPGTVALIPGMFPGQQLSALQMNQLQALQAAQLGGQHLVGLQGSQHAPQMGGQQNQQQQRKTLFTPYLPQASLPALLGDGQLVSGILRVNKKNRSDAYVATQDGLLDADIFICGSKDRNRALEGDLVAVELLDVDEVWAQKREKEEKKKRKDITDTRSGTSNGNAQAANGEGDTAPDGSIRRRGSLRQRPTQKKNDDVEVEGQSLLLVEEEEISDEQKPLYAGHIVAVIERVAGQMFSGTLGLLRPSSQATKEKQEAERAARDGGAHRQETRQQEKPKIVWFKPTDKRVPLIAIPTEQAPRDFVEKHQEYADSIFVACIKRWPITSLHPFGTLVEKLGKMGDLRVETDALLRDNNFSSDEFSDAVLRSVIQEWSIANENADELAARRDFRGEKTFTIDYNGAVELGNAIHVKTQRDGKIEIGIHVPDVTHFVKANSLVDREARKRGTAVHLVNRFCAMLPPKLSTDVCSLIPEQERLTISVVFQCHPHTGAIAEGDVWIGKSIVKSSGKLSLQEMDDALVSRSLTHPSVQLKDIQILSALAQKFREARLGSGSEPIAPLRLLQQLDDENIPIKHNIFDSTPAMELVEELMIKANTYVAQRLVQSLPEKALLRRQAPPNQRRLQTFIDRMRALGYDIDSSSSGSLQNSLFKVEDADIRKGMETLLLKTMQRAKYYVAGKTPKHLWPHYTLNLPLYTHFTSPTRRYCDIMVHRQLDAILSAGGAAEYTDDVETLVKTVELCNTKKDSAQNAQEQSIHIESCRKMDAKREELHGDLIAEGVVICVYESAFDVLIPDWGFEKRVHCDQLPLKKAEFRKEKRILELYWEKGVPSSAYVPEDERPKPSASMRMSNVAAAIKQAEEAERAKKEREEAARKHTETGTMSTDDVDALFDDDDDNASDITEAMAGASLAERPTQSVPGSPSRASGSLHRTRSDSKVPAPFEAIEARLTNKEKYLKLFATRVEGGEYIQDVREMTRVPVILKTDLTKSPPCLTIRSLNPFAL